MSTFNRKWRVRIVHALSLIDSVIYAESSDEFVITGTDLESDLHYSTSVRNEVIDYLFHARKVANCGNVLKFSVRELKFLTQFTTHPYEKLSEEKKKLKQVHFLPLSHDEYEVNFCGKNMISENLLNTGNHVNLADFEFLS